LGTGSFNYQPSAITVSGMSSGVVAVAAGGSHTCAVLDSGALKCWGANRAGQVGDGTTTQRLLPVEVIGLQSGVIGVAANAEHTCALLVGGAVRCWGQKLLGATG
jgi:alpha-tubulin suppressor-like RCC1 family protein